MALVFTRRASVYSTTAAASYATTGTYTPAANSLLVAFVVGAGNTNDPDHSTTPFAGHGVSWTKLTLSANALSTTHALSAWVADAGSSPTSAACTAQWASNRTGAAVIEFEVTGAELGGGASAAILQNPTNNGTGTSGSLNLAAATMAENRPLAFFVHLANEATTPRSLWTEDASADGNFNNPATGAEAQYRSDAFETTASASWTASSAWRGIALEVRAKITAALQTGAMTVSGAVASLAFTLGLTAGALALSGATPVPGIAGSATSIPAGALSLIGQSVGVAFAAPSTGELVLTGAAPSVSTAAGSITAAPPVGALVLTGVTPTPGISGGTTSVPAGALTLTGQSVGVAFTGPPTGTLTVTGNAPTVSLGTGGNTSIFTPVGSLAFDGKYVDPTFKGPDTGALVLTGLAPEITSSVKPIPAGALTLTGRTTPIGLMAAGTVGTLTITGLDPDVLVGGVTIGPPAGALSLTGRAPALAVEGSAALSVGVGSLAFSGTVPGVGIAVGTVHLLVDGVDRTSLLRLNTLEYTDDINARNTLSCELWDETGTYHPACGEDVVLLSADGVTRLFAGTIEEPEEVSLLGVETGYGIQITAVDYNQIPDRRLAAKVYDDTSFAAIVADLTSTYLAADNVLIGIVDDGPVFARKVFNYRTVAECFNELSEDTGYTWWISADKFLYFRARESVTAPFTISDTNETIRSFRVKQTRGEYRNRQFIRAGKDLTDPIAESFTGDATRQTFTVGFPIGQEPTITVNGVAQTVGIRGVEDDAAFDWYWNKDAAEISQRAASVPLVVSDLLVVTYRGLYPILIQAQTDTEIADRMAVEGGSGVYERIEDYSDVDSADLAFSTAVAKLRRNGFIRQVITFETDQDGLMSGQLVSITFPAHDVDGQYLVQAVRARDIESRFLRYTVTAISGDAVGGWIAFYQQLTSKRRLSVQRENELLMFLRSSSDTVTCTDSLLVDTPVARETRIGLAQIGRSEVGTT